MSYDGLVHFLIFKYTIYVHGRKICNLFVRALETDRKTSLCRTFLTCFAASERVQINLLFTDKVRISNLSRNAKKSKATAQLSEKNRNNRHSNVFNCVFCALHESGTRKAY
jgi:hypothetical protein